MTVFITIYRNKRWTYRAFMDFVINTVDTPGTNVSLQRQQRLTEEFVPRADLLLFLISAETLALECPGPWVWTLV
ncbi:unnamed protein product [Dovyalis caffra]|uniref:Uncharacterized protein n=1 Tax=Dovyalis caffra TaxID=77055 RepID=A0AAV1RNJ4_9ROSI|nr:unnamed protein product [Dovyalis caffra]